MEGSIKRAPQEEGAVQGAPLETTTLEAQQKTLSEGAQDALGHFARGVVAASFTELPQRKPQDVRYGVVHAGTLRGR